MPRKNLTETLPPTRVDRAMQRKLQADARRQRVPLSQVLRSIIREHYEREAAK